MYVSCTRLETLRIFIQTLISLVSHFCLSIITLAEYIET